MPRRSNFANSWAKLHKNERNTKGKLVFLYISEITGAVLLFVFLRRVDISMRVYLLIIVKLSSKIKHFCVFIRIFGIKIDNTYG